jgi:hypothetical protein
MWRGEGSSDSDRTGKIGTDLTLTFPKGGDTMIKAGDMFKNIESGKMFTVKSVDSSIIILGTKDGSHSMLVNPNSMESVFVPFVEDEVKANHKEWTKSEICPLFFKS